MTPRADSPLTVASKRLNIDFAFVIDEINQSLTRGKASLRLAGKDAFPFVEVTIQDSEHKTRFVAARIEVLKWAEPEHTLIHKALEPWIQHERERDAANVANRV